MSRVTQTGRRQPASPPETVSPQWLLRAFEGTVLLAALCGYLTFCVLFIQGQWQLVLHPQRPGLPLPPRMGTAVPETIHLGVDSSGLPQLTGVWLPGERGRYSGFTLLFLPSGDGSLVSAADRLGELQELGFNVFAIDYRGYGLSASVQPSQKRLESDSEAALDFLLQQRRVPEHHLVLYGQDLGGYLAARLASRHPDVPALIVDTPRLHVVQDVARDPRVRLLPVRLLFRQTFAIKPLLAELSTPKLLLRPEDGSQTEPQLAPPSMTVILGPTEDAQRQKALERFLDQYLSPQGVR